MTDKHYEVFANSLNTVKLPTSIERTDEARAHYERGCDLVLMYRGHPDVLWAAMQVFLAADCLPYVYAGTASVTRRASYISDGKYDIKGIRAAIQIFNKAKDINPYAFEILILEPMLYGSMADRKAMRYQLDQLASYEEAEESFRYASAEMSYWSDVDNIARVIEWHDRAMKVAVTDVQRLSALNSLAGTFMGQSNRMKEAIALYQKVVEIDPNDAWAWHNMSWIYYRVNDYGRAGVCNERALNIMDFGAARGIRANLIKRWAANRHADVLDDVPPYTIASNTTDMAAVFKRFFG